MIELLGDRRDFNTITKNHIFINMKIILTEEQFNRILLKEESNENVYITGKQPYPNTDWDLVHGILGSKRLQDDLEERVSQKLKSGNYRVFNIEINSTNNENEIVTNGWVGLKPDSNNPHKVFSTRGSIGGNHKQRHDEQISGLDGRLSNYAKGKGYKGDVNTFGPYTVDIDIPNGKMSYTQSFFAVS